MEKEGSKRVEFASIDDKHQITTVFGDFLPVQLTYKDKTIFWFKNAFHHLVFLLTGMHVTFSSNHWCNEDSYHAGPCNYETLTFANE